MPRISGVNIPEQKPIKISLTYIFGIGKKTALNILKRLSIRPELRAKDLTGEQILNLQNQVKEIVVEGEFDVISLFEEGISNTVAIKGTALTEEQVSLLSRFTQNIYLCFDQDSAGFEAVKRSILILEKKGLNTSVILIPNGKDPDEAMKNDPIVFKKAIKNKVQAYDFLFQKAFLLFDKKINKC